MSEYETSEYPLVVSSLVRYLGAVTCPLDEIHLLGPAESLRWRYYHRYPGSDSPSFEPRLETF